MLALLLVLRHRLVTPKLPRTPAPVWHGSGILRAPSGSTYPLYLKLRFERKHRGAAPTDGRTNLIGTAELCTMDGASYDLEVSGALDARRAQNGKPVVLYPRTEPNSGVKRFFVLYGSWQGASLVLADRGSFARFLATAPSAANPSRSTPPANYASDVSVPYGDKAVFDTMCPASAGAE